MDVLKRSDDKVLYGEKMKQILAKFGVDTSTLSDNLYSTLLDAIYNANVSSGGSDNTPTGTVTVDDVWLTNTSMVEGVTVYESKPIGNNNKTVATISLSGVNSITLMIKNLSEKDYDFTEAFEVDTENPSRNGGKFNAKGTEEWVKCVYNLDGGEHTIKVMYSKDSDGGTAPDKGYFYIESYS